MMPVLGKYFDNITQRIIWFSQCGKKSYQNPGLRVRDVKSTDYLELLRFNRDDKSMEAQSYRT